MSILLTTGYTMSEMTEQDFWAALAPADPPRVFYRLYYDEQGLPLFYSMQNAPGNYIEIDFEMYTNPPAHVRVVDGKLKILKTNQVPRLVPASVGTCCAPTDVCVVVDESIPHIKWSLKQHDPH